MIKASFARELSDNHYKSRWSEIKGLTEAIMKRANEGETDIRFPYIHQFYPEQLEEFEKNGFEVAHDGKFLHLKW